MATCTRIDAMVQAFIDGELSPSDRVIFEQHVSECRPCSEVVRKHQRSAAFLFEALAEHRLERSLRQQVLEHLPEMENAPSDLIGVNWRAKHPVHRWSLVARYVPLGVTALLVVGLVILNVYWPERLPASGAVGVITGHAGQAFHTTETDTTPVPATIEEFVNPEDQYETAAASNLMLTLAGPTQVKLNEDTRIKVIDERRLSLVKGEIWLDVGRDGRLFRVNTPGGQVTVFGTAFNIEVVQNATTVTVVEGEVQVETARDAFVLVNRGEQVQFSAQEEPTAPKPVNVSPIVSWSNQVVANTKAVKVFERYISHSETAAEIAAKDVHFIDIAQMGCSQLLGIRLSWQPDRYTGGHCGYDVYLYDSAWRPLFKQHVDAVVFDEKKQKSFEVSTPNGKTITGAWFNVRVIPDMPGKVETEVEVIGIAR
ncbi:MAG: FecR domain-containing protein [Candidatus Hydrogenedentes bacterium]|nr:FecR domain-containing protein [Candidatus Hydrogenedentota bacterium]